MSWNDRVVWSEGQFLLPQMALSGTRHALPQPAADPLFLGIQPLQY